ncbi:alpha/beta fold hydrolase [Dyella koreensis]|uniref:Maspardin n=1 Tax=Dyella koreensis TaxID=311235 RepID=A0ABW8KAU8_9GAMM
MTIHESVSAEVERDLKTYFSATPLLTVPTEDGLWTIRRRETSGSARPLLALPGIQGGSGIFCSLFARCDTQVELICADAPLLSEVDTMIRSTAQLLDQLDIGRIDLLGCSLGGYLAQAFAMAHPERVDRLVLSNSFYDASTYLQTLPSIDAIAASDAAVLLNKARISALSAPGIDAGSIRLQVVMATLLGPHQTAVQFKARMELLARTYPLPRTPLPDERVLLIDDSHDPVLPRPMRQAIRARYAASEHHAIPRGGHLPVVQQPDTFARLLFRWLRNTPFTTH